jgi:hypothetical protein
MVVLKDSTKLLLMKKIHVSVNYNQVMMCDYM